jgi:hypothetical protein
MVSGMIPAIRAAHLQLRGCATNRPTRVIGKEAKWPCGAIQETHRRQQKNAFKLMTGTIDGFYFANLQSR